jgi:TolA-binding protein
MIRKAAIFPFVYILFLFFSVNYISAQTMPVWDRELLQSIQTVIPPAQPKAAASKAQPKTAPEPAAQNAQLKTPAAAQGVRPNPVQPAPGYTRLQSGLTLFQGGRWQEAVTELRRAQAEAVDRELKAEALYWIALAKISAGEYNDAVKEMEDLEILAPNSLRLREIPYHKGRALYYLGRYDEAILLLKYYADGIGGLSTPAPGSDAAARKSAALYWLGECLYAMGQMDYARDFFRIITEEYPRSAKFEASSYRLGLINQKKIEEQLLYLLKWSHEESLKAIEEYQRRERSYDQALIAYQKRIAEMLRDGGSGTPAPRPPAQSQVYPPPAQQVYPPVQTQSSVSGEEKNRRLQAARSTAVELQNELTRLNGEN